MKKIVTVLLMLTCVLGLTACGGEKKVLNYDNDTIVKQSMDVYNIVSDATTNLDAIKEFNDDQLDEYAGDIFEQYGIKTEGKVLCTGIESWRGSLDEMGTISGTEPVEIKASEKELIATVPFNADKHNGSVEIIFDRNLHITSMTTNLDLELSEAMKKAGQNTLIGMGTVFTMLIVIMIIISCFSIIPKLQASAENKKNKKNIKEESVDNGIQAIVDREEEAAASDDLELVAVIAAAIAASEGASSTDGFVVRSIRRIK